MPKIILCVHLPDGLPPDEADALAAQIAANATVGDLVTAPSGKSYRIARIERVARVPQEV